MMNKEQLTYLISLQLTPLVGAKLAKTLIAYCGNPEAVFYEKRRALEKIPGIGKAIADSILNFRNFARAEKECDFIEKNNIETRVYFEDSYPDRLRHIDDAPLLLFSKGKCDLNQSRMIGVVGTRRATNYGKEICEQIVSELKDYKAVIVSGLAFGIDQCAHKTALKNNLETAAVLGHGLDIIYPGQHRTLANEIIGQGCILSEYISKTPPDRQNFPERNRIVAGMIDGLLVIESGIKGGALITADIAFSYNREVFAVPGRVNDPYSAGNNHFIKLNKAALVNSASDIAYALGWDKSLQKPKKKTINWSTLNETEKALLIHLQEKGKCHIDQLANITKINGSELSLTLLDLEFQGFIKAYPGNYYQCL
jgi:DNA processing protein